MEIPETIAFLGFGLFLGDVMYSRKNRASMVNSLFFNGLRFGATALCHQTVTDADSLPPATLPLLTANGGKLRFSHGIEQ